MNDHFVPEGIDWAGGAWLALTNDPFLIHFLHRWWSWIAALALLLLARTLSRRGAVREAGLLVAVVAAQMLLGIWTVVRSEEHTSELQSLMRISYAVFCLKKKQSRRCNRAAS